MHMSETPSKASVVHGPYNERPPDVMEAVSQCGLEEEV
jgi:hypothetical protein